MKATQEQREMFAAQYRFFEWWNGQIHSYDDVKKCVEDANRLCIRYADDPLFIKLICAVYRALEDQAKDELGVNEKVYNIHEKVDCILVDEKEIGGTKK